jgi:hypothetical protein
MIASAASSVRLAEVLDALLPGDRLSRSFSGPSIRLGTLTANGQRLAVPHAAIAFNFSKPANILSQLTTQRTFDRVVAFQQRSNPTKLILMDVTRGSCRVNP